VFTGIIENLARITHIALQGSNKTITLTSNIAHEFRVDQSIAHNGVCLTVIECVGHEYKVTAIEETLNRTTLHNWKENDWINIERCLPANGRFDGHIVQGHVDDTATCTKINDKNGSWEFHFELHGKYASPQLLVQKGSITINGTSLTLVQVNDLKFSVAIIPYTFEHTNFKQLTIGEKVNIEYDIVGKYIQKMMERRA
jgi:riboflavin synthase